MLRRARDRIDRDYAEPIAIPAQVAEDTAVDALVHALVPAPGGA